MPTRRHYLAATTGLLASLAGCTSSSDTTTTTQSTPTSTPTTQQTETTQPTTEQPTTERTTEQTTEEQTPNPAVQATQDAIQKIASAVGMIDDYAGPNQDMTDITAADTGFPNLNILNELRDANDIIQRGLEHASEQSRVNTLNALKQASGWLYSYTRYQAELMTAYGELTDARWEIYQESSSYEDDIEACEDALNNIDDFSEPVMNVDTSVFQPLDVLDAGTVTSKQTQLEAETSQIQTLANALPTLNGGLTTFMWAWTNYDEGSSETEQFEAAQGTCSSVADSLPDDWQPPLQAIGSKATCVADAVANGAGTMVEAALARKDGNTETANYRVESAREDVRSCDQTSGVEQLDDFLKT